MDPISWLVAAMTTIVLTALLAKPAENLGAKAYDLHVKLSSRRKDNQLSTNIPPPVDEQTASHEHKYEVFQDTQHQNSEFNNSKSQQHKIYNFSYKK